MNEKDPVEMIQTPKNVERYLRVVFTVGKSYRFFQVSGGPTSVFIFLGLSVCVLGGCLESKTHKCAWGTICPAGTICEPHSEQCVDPDLPLCGNGVVEQGEDCDDGNHDNTDDCIDGPEGYCRIARCGDGFVHHGEEECDDGNLVDFDGCTECVVTAFRINEDDYEHDHFYFGGLAMGPDGRFVAIWKGETSEASQTQVWARLYGGDGVPWGEAFSINGESRARGWDWGGDVAMAADGSFAVTWSCLDADDAGDGVGVLARCFDAQGTARGPPFLVNTSSAGDQSYPKIAMAPDGRFVVAWINEEVSGPRFVNARLYDSTGQPQGPAIVVNTEHAFEQDWNNGEVVDVTMISDGGFAVTWKPPSNLPEEPEETKKTFIKAFDSHGQPTGPALLLPAGDIPNSPPSEAGSFIAVAPSGRMAVIWRNADNQPTLQLLDRQGQPNLAPPSVVTALQSVSCVVVSFTTDGRFVVVFGDSNENRIHARRYRADGAPSGESFSVPAIRSGSEYLSNTFFRIAGAGDGRWLVGWATSGDVIYAQRFDWEGTPYGLLPYE